MYTHTGRDAQREPPAAWCNRCRGEIYPLEAGEDAIHCPDCRREDAEQITRRRKKRNMTLMELSKEYRAQAYVLRLRIQTLEEKRAALRDEGERFLLDDRIKMLESMWREARDLAVFTERYYDRRFRRNAKYTV